jgi:hypothetical protein
MTAMSLAEVIALILIRFIRPGNKATIAVIGLFLKADEFEYYFEIHCQLSH